MDVTNYENVARDGGQPFFQARGYGRHGNTAVVPATKSMGSFDMQQQQQQQHGPADDFSRESEDSFDAKQHRRYGGPDGVASESEDNLSVKQQQQQQQQQRREGADDCAKPESYGGGSIWEGQVRVPAHRGRVG